MANCKITMDNNENRKFNFAEIQFNYTTEEALRFLIKDKGIFTDVAKESLLRAIDDGCRSGMIMLPVKTDGGGVGFVTANIVFSKKEYTVN